MKVDPLTTQVYDYISKKTKMENMKLIRELLNLRFVNLSELVEHQREKH